MKYFVFILFILSFGLLPNGIAQTVVVPLDDGFYVIPTGCPLKPNNCAANPICDKARVVDSGKARVIISADMMGAGVTDPKNEPQDTDDIQSFVHMLTFSDRIDIEGILSGPNRSQNTSSNSKSRQRFIDIINAYEADMTKLANNFGTGFPNPQSLINVIRDGSRFHHPINATNSEANNAAVQHIIERARCGWHSGDKRPLYINSWGGSTDIAQAIFNAPDIKKVIRLIAYSEFNNGNFGFPPSGTLNQNSLNCFGFRCLTWNYLRSQNDLWWVDYTGKVLPVAECDTLGIIDKIQNRGALGKQIVDNKANGESCKEKGSPASHKSGDWYKLGDTWMLMYTQNSPELRNDPLSISPLKYGRYYQPDPNRSYWQLYNENLKRKDVIYNDWVNRATVLSN